MRGALAIAASLAFTAIVAVQPAAAEHYPTYHDQHVAQQQQCARARQNNTATGAVVGGVLGAVLGSQVAARGHRTDGSMLGGVLGAAAGAAIGNSSARRNCQTQVQGAYDPYYGQSQQPYGQRPYDDGTGLEGGPYGTDYGYEQPRSRGGRECRWGEQIMRDPDGYEYRENVYMCRGRDGVWRAQ